MSKIGFVGLGRMGMPVLSRLKSSFQITGIYNRNRAKTTLFKPIRSYDEPFQLAVACDIILVMVSGDEACEEVMFGKNGIEKTLVPGSTVINLSSVSLDFSLSAHRRISDRGSRYLDAPVIGSVDLALEGKLVTLVSGDSEAFRSVENILQAFSSDIIYLGVAGNAVKMNLISHMAMAANLAIASEAIISAEHAGIQKERAMEVLLKGNASSRILEIKRNIMMDEQFVPGFPLEDMIRNLAYGITMSGKISSPVPMESAAMQFYVAASSIGLGKLDYSSVLRAFRFLSGKS